MIPPRSDKRAWEIYRHSMELANIDGKPLEVRGIGVIQWSPRDDGHCGGPLYWEGNDYRLAPEPPSITPWTFETAPSVLKVRSKKDGELFLAVCYPGFVNMGQGVGLREIFYSDLAERFEQLSGEPCGVKAEAQWPKYYRHEKDGCNHIWRQDAEGDTLCTWIEFRGAKRGDTGVVEFSRADFVPSGGDWKEIPAAEAEALLKGAK